MQLLVDRLRRDGRIFKRLQSILPKDLGVKNRIAIYKATDLQGNFWAILHISQKSKIFIKDVKKLEEIYSKLVIFADHNFKHKLIIIDSPLCYKAKDALLQALWKVK
ncbi:MAG: hypothetical protein WCR69_06520 [Sulfuricurvum sp.]|jgi:hypothetical protein